MCPDCHLVYTLLLLQVTFLFSNSTGAEVKAGAWGCSKPQHTGKPLSKQHFPTHKEQNNVFQSRTVSSRDTELVETWNWQGGKTAGRHQSRNIGPTSAAKAHHAQRGHGSITGHLPVPPRPVQTRAAHTTGCATNASYHGQVVSLQETGKSLDKKRM